MRKLSTIIYGIIIAISISSCSNENNDIFGESPAKRLNRAVKEYTELLCSSESGWAMEYFANEQKKGYTLLIQFRETDGVTIAAKDDYTKNEYAEENSHFKVIADNGPVLSFNTYNKLLHYFADPAGDTTGDNGDGRGHEGDYEFIVMKASDDLIELQGKKRGYTILLRRLPEGQDWEAYLKKLEDVKSSIFSAKIPYLWFTASNGERYTLTNSASGIFDAVPEGGDAISQTVKLSYVTEEKAIRLLKPFTGNKDAFSVQVFNITEGGGALTSVEDGASNIVAPIPTDVFCNEATWQNGNSWKLVPTEISGKLKELYDITMAKSLASFGVTVDLSFKYNTAMSGQSFSFNLRGNTNGARGISLSRDDNNGNQIQFTVKDSKDTNWNNFIKKVPEIDTFIEQLALNAYTISANSIIKPTILKFTSTANANDCFVVNLD